MKLVHPEHSFQVEFVEGQITELIIEEPHVFTEFIFELLQQIEGEEGRFVLSDNNELLRLSDRVECVINPFGLDMNQKKVLNRLYQLIKQEVLYSELMIELGDVHSQLIEIINEIQDLVEYPLSFQDEIDVIAFLKYMDLKITNVGGSLLEQIIDYTKLMAHLMKQDMMVLVNIQSYLREEELQALLKHVRYEKINLILIENLDRGILRPNVKRIIIDKDRCEIF